MAKEFRFERYDGQQLQTERLDRMAEMEQVFKSRKCDKEDVLQYIDEDAHILCMFDKDAMVGFAWLVLAERMKLAELCWFVTDRDRIKGMDAKYLLNEVVDYCKEKDVRSIKFNCFAQSWDKIDNKDKLFERIGYNIVHDDNYDITINLE